MNENSSWQFWRCVLINFPNKLFSAVFQTFYTAWEMQTGQASIWVLCKCDVGQIPQIPPHINNLQEKMWENGPDYPLNMLYARSIWYQEPIEQDRCAPDDMLLFHQQQDPPRIKKDFCKSAKSESSKQSSFSSFFVCFFPQLCYTSVLPQLPTKALWYKAASMLAC